MTTTRSLSAVTHDALEILTRELGVAETARFLGQFDLGLGDYTEERAAYFRGMDTEAFIQEALSFRDEPSGGDGA